jgi:hypothetical protein
MKHSKQGLQTVQVIYQEKYLKLSTLKALTVPRIYPHEIALVRFIQSLEQSGDAILETVCLRVRKRILGVSLTELGVSRWIEGKRDDICKRRRYKPTNEVMVTVEQKAEQMPCKARLTKCYSKGCYLRFICPIKSEEQLMEEL